MAAEPPPGPSSGRTLAPTGRLTPAVRRGYGLGSVATGSFGTVPGLLLLPYLTDRLGVAAGVAGLVVFLPKAWDVILNPVAGRISDRSTNPAGRRRPFLIRSGSLLALAFVLLFAGPTSPTGLAATWVVVLFLACATAYAFFQVPYVAMPAEMTDDYDERTRLMTWRVAILALAILVSGGLSPVIRNQLGPEWGYRGVGLFVGALILVGTFGAWWGTRNTHMTDAATAGGSLRDQLRVVAASREFRTLLTVFVLQALATGAMLAGVDYVARVLLGSSGASTILFVCFVAPALLVTPLWQRVGEARGKRTGYFWGSFLLAGGALATLLTVQVGIAATAASVAVVGIGYAACQMFPLAMLPDVAAADTAAHRREPGRHLHGRVDRGGDPRPGARAVPVCRRAHPRRVRLLDRRVAPRSPSRRRPPSRSASRSSRPRSSRSHCWCCAGTGSTRRCPGDPTDDGGRAARGDDRRGARDAARAAGDGPAGARRPHPRLRLRLRARRRGCRGARGAGDVRRVERVGPHRLSLAAADGERPRRARRGPARRARRVRRVGHLRRHRVDPARGAGGPAGLARGRPTRAWCSPPRRTPRSTRRPSSSGCAPCSSTVDPDTLRADPAAMAAAVDDTTVLVVASAPSYAHGVVDPVPEIAALAAARGIRCHVDACIGGWVLPHLDDAPPWTFAVDGVTSISVDLHKYAYTPKGVSVLLHRTPALRRGHFFASANWPGYTMLNSTMQSTRSGGPLAAAWAVTRRIGVDGLRRAGPAGAGGDARGRDRGGRHPGHRRAHPARLDPRRPRGRRVVRRLHHRRRDARARLVRAAADVVRRGSVDPAPHPVGRDGALGARARRGAARVGGCRARGRPRRPRPGPGRPAGVDRPGDPRRRRRSPGCWLPRGSPVPTARSPCPRGWRRSTPCSTPARPRCARPCCSVCSTACHARRPAEAAPPARPRADGRLPPDRRGYWLGRIPHRTPEGPRWPPRRPRRRARPVAHRRQHRAAAPGADHRRQPRCDGGAVARPRGAGRPRERHPDDVCRAGRRGRPARARAGGGRHRQG